jgi:hypothetical protein
VSTTVNQPALNNVVMKIQENLDRELADTLPPYCPTETSCELLSRVYLVNTDETLTSVLATRKLRDVCEHHDVDFAQVKQAPTARAHRAP